MYNYAYFFHGLLSLKLIINELVNGFSVLKKDLKKKTKYLSVLHFYDH